VLHLADLRPSTPTRVLVRLESLKASAGDRASLAATVTWRSLDGVRHASEVAFSTGVVEDLETVTRTRDEAVFSRGIGAVGNLKLLAAAAAWERGDTAGATNLLDNARALFGMSADALAGETQVEEVRQGLNKATGTQERREFARGLEKKKLIHFGMENSGY